MITADELYTKVTRKALAHGTDSDPDHEVGDLQQALHVALRFVDPKALDMLHREVASLGLYGWEVVQAYVGPDSPSGLAEGTALASGEDATDARDRSYLQLFHEYSYTDDEAEAELDNLVLVEAIDLTLPD